MLLCDLGKGKNAVAFALFDTSTIEAEEFVALFGSADGTLRDPKKTPPSSHAALQLRHLQLGIKGKDYTDTSQRLAIAVLSSLLKHMVVAAAATPPSPLILPPPPPPASPPRVVAVDGGAGAATEVTPPPPPKKRRHPHRNQSGKKGPRKRRTATVAQMLTREEVAADKDLSRRRSLRQLAVGCGPFTPHELTLGDARSSLLSAESGGMLPAVLSAHAQLINAALARSGLESVVASALGSNAFGEVIDMRALLSTSERHGDLSTVERLYCYVEVGDAEVMGDESGTVWIVLEMDFASRKLAL